MEFKKEKTLRPFYKHGCRWRAHTDRQAISDCPFCGKARKFYVNADTGQWDCKVCDRRGNLWTFFSQMGAENVDCTDDKDYELLAQKRGLPEHLLRKWQLGWNGEEWTIPVFKASGKGCCDLRGWKPGRKGVRACAGAKVGMLGMRTLMDPTKADQTVYLCEGIWDCIAVAWLLEAAGKKGVVVGVPGASQFKRDWIPLFDGRDVVVLYDNDSAAERGMRVVSDRIGNIANLKFVHWPPGLPDGFDMRDFCHAENERKGGLKSGFRKLQRLLDQALPGLLSSADETQEDEAEKRKVSELRYDEVYLRFKRWLDLPNQEALWVIFGTILANRISGEPLWLFLVAPPGGGKTELLMPLTGHPEIETTTSLTPATLVSGASLMGGGDPSLIPQLDGKVLIIKDFTTILTMHSNVRDEIFGVLRDAYDGQIKKIYGTGIVRRYESHFGIIAGVTPAIDTHAAMHGSLGERFLKYRLAMPKLDDEAARIEKALNNLASEEEMRAALMEAAHGALEMRMPDPLPTINPKRLKRLVALAQFCAWLRGSVTRDKFSREVLHKPTREVGTRLAKQLSKLCVGMACFRRKTHVGKRETKIASKMARDSIPDRIEEVVKQLWYHGPIGTRELGGRSRLPTSTIQRILEDLTWLGIVKKAGTVTRKVWSLTPKVQLLIRRGKIYKEPER